MSRPSETPKVAFAHISDTHIGYEAYPALSANGENQRAVDIGRAFHAAVDQILEWDPPLVVHSGDLGERPHLPNRWMLFARAELARLAGVRPDGTRRQLVILAGNHDQPSQRRERCWIDLVSDLPGIHVVTGDPEKITFDDSADAALADVEVLAVPHEALKHLDEFSDDLMRPTSGRISILAAHGVAGGSSLFRRSVGREFHIPTDLLGAGWAYGALGHWHRRGPIDSNLGGRVFYAGSTENMGFGDLRDNGDRRGWNKVVVSADELPEVTQMDVPIRMMVRDKVDVSSLTPDQIHKKLSEHISKLESAGRLDDAVVGVVATGTTRDVWNLVDRESLRERASRALHFELISSPADTAAVDNELPDRVGGDLWAALSERAEVVLDSSQRNKALDVARSLLAKELKLSAEELDAAATADDINNEQTDEQPVTAGNELKGSKS